MVVNWIIDKLLGKRKRHYCCSCGREVIPDSDWVFNRFVAAFQHRDCVPSVVSLLGDDYVEFYLSNGLEPKWRTV